MLGRASEKISGEASKHATAEFAQEIMDAVVSKSTKLMIECLAGETFKHDNALVKAVATGLGRIGNLDINLSAKTAIVAVGGPAEIIYPAVGKRLNTKVLIPQNSEVANAIGAAISMIKVRAIIEITYADKGGFLIHHLGAPETMGNGNDAIDRARQLALDQAKSEAQAMGGTQFEIDVSIKRIDLPGVDSKNSLMAATVTAEVVSELALI